MSQEYKYDVAISFLEEDEQIAIEIADRLGDRVGVDVFVYSKRQNDLVGKDGLEAFSGLFGEQSRVVVILHRDGWGQTPWTRVEENAIKNRGFDQGWDFLLLIRLDKSAIPKWLPKTRIWFAFDQYGINGAASAIETVVQQEGGDVRADTAVDFAGRIARGMNFERERVSWYSSERGIADAISEPKALLEELAKLATEIQEKHSALGLAIEAAADSVVVRSAGYSLVLGWSRGNIINTLSGSYLFAKLFSGSISERPYFFPEKDPKEIAVTRYDPDIDRTLAPGWRERDGETKFFTSSQLVDLWLKRLLAQTT